MPALTHTPSGWTIGEGRPLAVMAGLNVLEDEALALEVGTELKQICARLGLPYVFKASFDKANRSSITSYRGPGLEAGLKTLAAVKSRLGVPVVTDLHEPSQAEAVAEVADILQLPAFLVRQTDLVIATAKAAQKAGALIQAKKAQFMAPWDAKNILTKIAEVAPDVGVILCERGVSFGYNTLVSDMRALPILAETGYPVVFDATHSVQQPGGRGGSSGGQREFVPVLARAAVSIGVAAIFMETHQDPDAAPSDGPNMVPLPRLEAILRDLIAFDRLAKTHPISLS